MKHRVTYIRPKRNADAKVLALAVLQALGIIASLWIIWFSLWVIWG